MTEIIWFDGQFKQGHNFAITNLHCRIASVSSHDLLTEVAWTIFGLQNKVIQNHKSKVQRSDYKGYPTFKYNYIYMWFTGWRVLAIHSERKSHTVLNCVLVHFNLSWESGDRETEMNGRVRRVEGKITQWFSVGKVKWANLPCVRLSKPMEFQS